MRPIRENGIAKLGKTAFSNFSFTPEKKFEEWIENIENIKKGLVSDIELDGKEIGIVINIWENGKNSVIIKLNYKNVQKIVFDHGSLPSNELVQTINAYDQGIYIPGMPPLIRDKINLIKSKPNGGIYVAGANRINGYGLVTFFEQLTPEQAQHYLVSIKKRGSVF